MNRTRRRSPVAAARSLAALCVPFLAVGAAPRVALGAGAEYSFTLIEAFDPNYDLREVMLRDINESGVIVGTSTDAGFYSGFYWTQPTDKIRVPILWPAAVNNTGYAAGANVLLRLDTLESVTLPAVSGAVRPPQAMGMNDSSVVVGFAETCNCSNSQQLLQIPFVWDPVNGMRNVNVPNAKELLRVNANGIAVGVIRGGTTGHNGYVFNTNTGAYTLLGDFLPTPMWMTAMDINDAGEVVGEVRSPEVLYSGYIWSESAGLSMLPGVVAGADFRAKGINNHRVVVGWGEAEPGGATRALVWDAAHGTRDLNTLVAGMPPNFILDWALKVNDAGQIIGVGHYGPNWGTSRGFMLTPEAACPGDTNADGVVNFADLNIVLAQFGQGGSQPLAGDVNADGTVNFADLNIVLGAFGVVC